MADSVEHFIEGRNAWKVGLLGFLSRLRGILITIAVTLGTMSTPFWWPKNFSTTISFQLKYGFFILVLAGGILTVLSFYYLRQRTRRSLDIKHYLHQLAHYLRDFQTELYQKGISVSPNAHSAEYFKMFQSHGDNICERIKDFFARLTKDITTEVAIRIAKNFRTDSGKDEIVYTTIARSSGLSSKRQETTEDISANEGIPRFFIEEKDSQGVLIYNNLRKAADVGAYKFTKNDQKYSDEISSMMVAPLNGWDGNQVNMLGILYVTSREKNAFSVIHVDSMRFVADTIAKSFASFSRTKT